MSLDTTHNPGHEHDYALLFDILDAQHTGLLTRKIFEDSLEVLISDGKDHTITINIPKGSPLYEDITYLQNIIEKTGGPKESNREY